MKREIKNINIIVLANNHNPAISTKDWLIKKEIFNKEPIKFLNTEVFSAFENNDYIFQVDEKRLLLQAKNPSSANIDDLGQKINKYVKTLPETPYIALGFNIKWEYQQSVPEEKIIEVLKNQFCNKPSKIKTALNTDEFKFGGIFIFNEKSNQITLKINPDTNKERFIADFNCHHKISQVENELRRKEINNFTSELLKFYNDAKNILDNLFQ